MLLLFLALVVLLISSLYLNYMFLDNIVDVEKPISVDHSDSQSYQHQLRLEHDQGFRETELDSETNFMHMAIYNNSAYWVSNNGLVTAPLDSDGEVIREDARVVDVHSLTSKEVSHMMSILDALKEADDEGSSSGE